MATHGVDWLRLVADSVLDESRTEEEESQLKCYWEHFPEFQNLAADAAAAEDAAQVKISKRPAQKTKKLPKQKKKRTVAPGPFRIFTKEIETGKKGDKDNPPDMKQVSKKYHALPPSERVRLKRTRQTRASS